MQFTFFTIPAAASEEAEEELNKFLRSHRVLTVNREFVPDVANPRWCLAVEYLEGQTPGKRKSDNRRRIDYKEILTPEDFTLFAKLREWRKARAEEEGVPVYTIFTNDQLAKIAGQRLSTKAGLAELEGVGEGRISKYGEAALAIVKDETAGQKTRAEEEPL